MNVEQILLRAVDRQRRIEHQRDVVGGLRVSGNGPLIADAEVLLKQLQEQQEKDLLLLIELNR